MLLPYTIVIATYERADDLARMLASVKQQTHPPELTIIVDSSRDELTRAVAEGMRDQLPLRYERAEVASAAQQRNQGAKLVTTPLIAFIDDDAVLRPDTCAKLAAVFSQDPNAEIGGVAGRIDGETRPAPRGLLWWYYRIQAGYAHPTYGGRLFGPAINCYPSYTEADGELIPADWLSSTCVFYRTDAFLSQLFPAFEGYSFMEDVHLSARIGKSHKLYFHRDALFEHNDAPSSWKRDFLGLARSRIRNQRLVARDLLQFSGLRFELKLFLHRLFVSVYLLRRRGRGAWQEFLGTWMSGRQLSNR